MARAGDDAPLPILGDTQREASRPDAQVWLSASAGAGKTQVLTSRVLRLLLHGNDPEAILCLTFTKAGAAEMAHRIHQKLGRWATMPDKDLSKELFALGEEHAGNRLAEARTLFAKVLDARGGGLRIQTIHSFAQTLLAAFPAEADLPVGFRPVEGREEEAIAEKALGDMVVRAEREGRMGVIDRLQAVSKRLGEDATRALLRRCAQAPDAMAAFGGNDLEAFVRRALSGGIDDVSGWLERACEDDVFDVEGLRRVADANASWMKKDGGIHSDGLEAAARANAWLAASVSERAVSLGQLELIWRTTKGESRKKTPPGEGYEQDVERLTALVDRLLDATRIIAIAPVLAAALTVGQDYAQAYAAAKRAAGVVDFNDMIRATVKLLAQPGIGEWVRYKLDQSVDHILVDEAQDTNAAQWDIVKALAEEFFAGTGAKDTRVRTVFAVGDFKQAIFGFQGTDPGQFVDAGSYFREQAAAADDRLQNLTLAQSFRSSQPILDVVDAVIGEVGFEAMGLPGPPDPHVSATRRQSGRIVLLKPMTDAGRDESEAEEAEEGWFSDAELNWASDLARRVKAWTTGGLVLANQDEPRNARPGDIMILLRSRTDLARLIVSRLYEEQVPVAGVDRLRLNAPIAVQDLLACVRFALQPADDLTLAALLVSPLIGWTQDELFARAHGRTRGLWRHLRETLDASLLTVPHTLLDMADRTTPYMFLETILSGPIQGRAKLIARLGEEARDPVEELLNAALQFESTATPSLQGFVDWFDRDATDIKRDPSKPEDAVRVMTVHGAKGLQAPVVVLADATADPDNKRSGDLDWAVDEGVTLPVFRPRREELAGSLKDAAEARDKREREEHWRLLYVAMTRAEEHLFVGGALSRRQQGDKGMAENCWHRRVEAAMTAMGAEETADGWLIEGQDGKRGPAARKEALTGAAPPIPGWARQQAPEERRPPRPLAPSALGIDDAASPPPDAALRDAAERGVLLHALFERLPAVDAARRRDAAVDWLARRGRTHDGDALAALALDIIDHPGFAAIFGPDALAEAPIAGVVDGEVIAGTVDRLLVTGDDVLVVDFKTGRRVPRDASGIPAYHCTQMGAYAALLRSIFPDRRVRAALLYTQGPVLIELSDDQLARWRPDRSH
jgi:ATP-dependent helicase/nuclease subunit A